MMRAGLVVLAAALASCGGCEPVTGPEIEIARILEAQSKGATIAVPGAGTLALSKVRFDRVLVKPEGEGFTAVATVDADGALDGMAVGYLGLERVPFVRRGAQWVPKTSLLPALVEVASLLAERHSALRRHDATAIERLVAHGWSDRRLSREEALSQMRDRVRDASGDERAVRWIIRIEREGAEVLEELDRATGTSGRGQVRFQLGREEGRFRFVAGLL